MDSIIEVVLPDNSVRIVTVSGYRTLMEALVGEGFSEVLGRCGGYATCGTCHVYDASFALGSEVRRTPIEDEVLADVPAEVTPRSRLSCRIRLRAGRNYQIVLPTRQ